MLFNQTNHILLLTQHEVIQHLVAHSDLGGTAIQFVVNDTVVNAVQAEVHQTGQNGLAVFCDQKVFQMVVAQRRELNVNLTDNTDLLWA